MQTSRSALRPLARSISKSTPLLRPAASRIAIRTLATVVPGSESLPVAATPSSNNGALRPHLNIPVDPNHGLYAFFRKTEKDGVVSYEALDAKDPLKDNTGRSWTAPELRRKSFKDLHTLWYVLLRERNLLATQNEEARRIGGDGLRTPNIPKAHRVRKSMARIKYVINERRLAYEGAVRIHEERRQAVLAEKEAKKEAIAEKTVAEVQPAQEAILGEGAKAAQLAASALFDTVHVPQRSGTKKV